MNRVLSVLVQKAHTRSDHNDVCSAKCRHPYVMMTMMLFSLLVLARVSAAQPIPDAPADWMPPPPPPQPAAGLDAAGDGTLVPPTVVVTMPLYLHAVVEMTAGSENVTMVLSTGNQKQQASVIAYPSECVDTVDDVAKNLLNGSFSWAGTGPRLCTSERVSRMARLCSWAWHGSRAS